MKINYTISGSAILTGGIRVILEIANGLAKKGHDVTVLHAGRDKDAAWFPLKASLISPNFLEWFIYKSTGRILEKIYNNSSYRVLGDVKLLDKNTPNCDINIATNWESVSTVFRCQKGIPFYHLQHLEELFTENPFDKMKVRETYYLPMNKIYNSLWLKEQMIKNFDISAPVVNPSIDHNIFYPRYIEKKKKKKRVVCFGRQIEWKGFKDAIEAMKLVFKQRNDIEWLVYGAYPVTYKDSSAPYTFLQHISDKQLAELYSSADVVFCPSWYESFPLPPIEAMACGAPVITTRYGTEDYAFDGKNSLVVMPRDPNMLASSILKLLDNEDLRETFKKEGPKTAKKFTWDKTVDDVEKLFKEALLQ